jgi:hypothetical protein
MALNVGGLIIRIGTDVTGLTNGMRQAETTLGRVGLLAGNTTKLFTGLAAGLAGVGLVAFVKSTIDTIDAQSKLAYRLNTTVESIQSLAHAADLSGIASEALTGQLGVLNTRLGQAARDGASPAAEALRRMGLSAQELIALPVDERLAVIADRFVELRMNTQAQGDALRQLGIRNQEMLNLMEGGGAQIRAAREEVRRYGMAVTDVDAKSIEEANDAWTRAMGIVRGVAIQLGVALAPFIKEVGDNFVEAGTKAGGFGNVVKRAVVEVFGFMDTLEQIVFTIQSNLTPLAVGFQRVATGAQLAWQSINPLVGGDAMRKTFADGEAAIAKLRGAVSTPPEANRWRTWAEELTAKLSAESAKSLANRKEMTDRQIDLGEQLTSREKTALDEKFRALQRSVATEAQALDMARADELAKLQEFEDKKIGTVAEREAVRQAIMRKFRQDESDFVFTKLEADSITEQEQLKKRFDDQIRLINEAREAGRISETRAGDLSRRYQEKLSRDLMQLQARQWSGLANIVDTTMSQISAVIGKEGGAAFEIMKGISIATALVKGYEAVLAAYTAGNLVGGPPVGAAFAAIAAAGVAAQIAAMAAVKPGDGGTTASAPVASGSTDAAAAGAGGGQSQTMYFKADWDSNSMYSGESVRRMANALVEFQKDGGKVILA